MFISKQREIVVPQSEHQNLAGILARHWGNSDFELPPPINKEAFVLGVATHDRAFGFLDTDALGSISEERREQQIDEWLSTAYEDTETELVVLLHVRRLFDTSERQHLYKKVDDQIQKMVSDNNIDLSPYEQADTITDLCDMIAFDFAFESPVERTMSVYQNENTTTDITYLLKDGVITFDKNPFSVSEIKGYILGYKKDNYPTKLEPVLMDFKVRVG